MLTKVNPTSQLAHDHEVHASNTLCLQRRQMLKSIKFERAYRMQAEALVDRVSGVLRSTEQAVFYPDLPRRSYLDTWARQCAAPP